MDKEQGRRFDAFSSAVIPKAAIKKVGPHSSNRSSSINRLIDHYSFVLPFRNVLGDEEGRTSLMAKYRAAPSFWICVDV